MFLNFLKRVSFRSPIILKSNKELGIDHVRDTDFPCLDFMKGVSGKGDCKGDGHYLCRECILYKM